MHTIANYLNSWLVDAIWRYSYDMSHKYTRLKFALQPIIDDI